MSEGEVEAEYMEGGRKDLWGKLRRVGWKIWAGGKQAELFVTLQDL